MTLLVHAWLIIDRFFPPKGGHCFSITLTFSSKLWAAIILRVLKLVLLIFTHRGDDDCDDYKLATETARSRRLWLASCPRDIKYEESFSLPRLPSHFPEFLSGLKASGNLGSGRTAQPCPARSLVAASFLGDQG